MAGFRLRRRTDAPGTATEPSGWTARCWPRILALFLGAAVLLVPIQQILVGAAQLYRNSLQGQPNDHFLTDAHAIQAGVSALRAEAGSDEILSFTATADRLQQVFPDDADSNSGRLLQYQMPGTVGGSGVRAMGSAFVGSGAAPVKIEHIPWDQIPALTREVTEHMVRAGFPEVATADQRRFVMEAAPAEGQRQYRVLFRPQLISVTFDAAGTIVQTSPSANAQGRHSLNLLRDQQQLDAAVADLRELVQDQPINNLSLTPRRITVAVAVDGADRLRIYQWTPPDVHGVSGAHELRSVDVSVRHPEQLFRLDDVPWHDLDGVAEETLAQHGLQPSAERMGDIVLSIEPQPERAKPRLNASVVTEGGIETTHFDLDGNLLQE